VSASEKRVTRGQRVEVQAIEITGSPPANMRAFAGFVFAEGDQIPRSMRQVSSPVYSLGSPRVAGDVVYAVTLYSAGSPAIPDTMARIAIVP